MSLNFPSSRSFVGGRGACYPVGARCHPTARDQLVVGLLGLKRRQQSHNNNKRRDSTHFSALRDGPGGI